MSSRTGFVKGSTYITRCWVFTAYARVLAYGVIYINEIILMII